MYTQFCIKNIRLTILDNTANFLEVSVVHFSSLAALGDGLKNITAPIRNKSKNGSYNGGDSNVITQKRQ